MGCSCLKKKIKFQILLPLSSHNHYHRSGCAVIGIRKSVNRQGGRWQKVKTRGLDKREKQEHQKKIRTDQTATSLIWPHIFVYIIGARLFTLFPHSCDTTCIFQNNNKMGKWQNIQQNVKVTHWNWLFFPLKL